MRSKLAVAVVLLTAAVTRAQDNDEVRATPPPDEEARQSAIDALEAAPAPPKMEKEAPASGFVPGIGFVLNSPDGNYQLKFGLKAGYKIEPRWNDGESLDRRALYVIRPSLGGHLYREWLKFGTTFEFANNPPFVLDTFVDVKPWTEFGLRFGQFWTPYSRHEYFGPMEILFPEWNVVAEYFWTGRDKGVQAFGTLGSVDYFVGAFGGSPLRAFTTLDGNYVFQARATVTPVGEGIAASEFPYITSDGKPAPFGVSFTAQGYYGNVETAVENFNPSTFRFDVSPSGNRGRNTGAAVDLHVQGSRFVFFAEGYMRHNDPTGSPTFYSWGAWAQAGVLLIDQTLDFALRGSWLDPSDDLGDDRLWAGEAQFAYYIDAPWLVLKLRYGIAEQDTPAGDPGPVVIPLEDGTTQIATLQFNLAF